MAEFATFIAPSASGFGAWHTVVAFGDRLSNGRSSGLVHLEVDHIDDAKLYAPFDGKLSTRQPTGFLQPVFEALPNDAPDSPTVTLYVEPVAAKLGAGWSGVSHLLANRYRPDAS